MPKQPKPIIEAEKKSAISSFWDNIKNFFRGIKDKVKEFWDYARNRTPQDDKPVDKTQEINRTFKASDRLYQEDEKFPGFDEMTMSRGGYVKLPPGTEQVWAFRDNDDATKYLNAIHAKIPGIQDPAATHQGEFITEIAKTIEYALHKKQDMVQMYAVGNSIIAAQVNDGHVLVTMRDGEHSMQFETDSAPDLRNHVANWYAQFSGYQNQANFYIDTQTGVRYMQLQNDNNGYDTYIAEPMKRHINDYDSKQGISHKSVMEGVIEVKGPDILPRAFIDKAIYVDNPMDWKDFANITTAMHESLFTEEGQKGRTPQTQETCQSLYVTYNKIFWMTRNESGDFVAHVAPVHCAYPNVATIDVPVPQEAMSWSKEGNKSLAYALKHACGQLDKVIADLDARAIEADRIREGLDDTQKKDEDNVPHADDIDIDIDIDIDDGSR